MARRISQNAAIAEKKFTHKKIDPNLGKHKDKHGYPCPGRTVFYIDMKYWPGLCRILTPEPDLLYFSE